MNISETPIVFNNKFIAFATGGNILTSTDGNMFTLSDASVLANCHSLTVPFVASCGTYAIAVYKNTSNQTVIAGTQDGNSWTAISSLDITLQTATQVFCSGAYWWFITSTGIWYAPV